ncbi:3D domain-containing protein [Exiguobacterium acetylicum]|uniref:3D domain-containing protein n=1 Tax=Exiguobacterium acetylicum TaxID=41170 RepID=UPI001EE218D8|nr:3D domain-containing protein [Exiguobacterium acetylicum]UKS54838.1 murein transglycosylase [Exiguobacterium acetylicum]
MKRTSFLLSLCIAGFIFILLPQHEASAAQIGIGTEKTIVQNPLEMKRQAAQEKREQAEARKQARLQAEQKAKTEQRAKLDAKKKAQQATKQSHVQAQSNSSSKRTETFETTAYTTNPENNGSRLYNGRALTASGYDVTNTITYEGRRIVAVDPSVVPLGTKVHVEGFGDAIALDTGGAIRGKIMDLLVGSKQEALEWGRRHVTVTFE